jgi:nuclear transcription factor Y gamma
MSNGSEDRSEHPQELNGSSPTPLMTPQEQEIDDFWRRRQEDIENLMNFNNHNLPIENIEEIIRANLGSVMTSSDTPPYVTKLCELFIQELAIRAWMCASSHGRYTILESDITEAINSTKPYSFLNGVLPRHGTNHDQESTSSNMSQLLQVHNITLETPFLSIIITHLTQNVQFAFFRRHNFLQQVMKVSELPHQP